MKHHMLTIIVGRGICHTKSLKSSHWRPGCNCTASDGRISKRNATLMLIKKSLGWELHARLRHINFCTIKINSTIKSLKGYQTSNVCPHGKVTVVLFVWLLLSILVIVPSNISFIICSFYLFSLRKYYG